MDKKDDDVVKALVEYHMVVDPAYAEYDRIEKKAYDEYLEKTKEIRNNE